ncbi:MAG TPA: transposase [Chryseosolibacter sp.]
MNYAKDYAQFVTITCLGWKPVLATKTAKEIVVNSLRFLNKLNRIDVFAFCIMDNHMHLIWQLLNENKREDVQRDFLKYTSQRILKHLNATNPDFVAQLRVSANDRRYQVWKRNSLSIPLYSEYVLNQKLRYIHENPVAAGLCSYPEEYHYSSARFYRNNDATFDFLSHIAG